MVWKVLVIGLLILTVYFGYLVYQLWQSAKRLFASGAAFGAAFENYAEPHLKDYLAAKNVFADPSRVTAARKARKQVREVRNTNRQKRLNAAAKRWDVLSDNSFANIDSLAQAKAKEYRQHRRQEKQNKLSDKMK
ncbi:hypothetical protein RQN30_01095 [Arcanobacterium hippocoleae]